MLSLPSPPPLLLLLVEEEEVRKVVGLAVTKAPYATKITQCLCGICDIRVICVSLLVSAIDAASSTCGQLAAV